ncbi:hypothetical protein ACT3HK_11330 [Thermolongibacillus altinsuensis]
MEVLFELLGGLVEIFALFGMDGVMVKRRLKQLRKEQWFTSYYPKDKDTLKKMINDHEIRKHLIFTSEYKKLLNDPETQREFINLIMKHL